MISAVRVVKLIAVFSAETALSCAYHVLFTSHMKYCYGHVYSGELTAQKNKIAPKKKQPFPLIIDTMSAIVDFTDICEKCVLGFHDALK